MLFRSGRNGYAACGTSLCCAPFLATPAMKKGGKVHEDEAQDRTMIRKAMAGKKFKTGGVANAQGGYKTGGVANAQGGYKTGGMIKPAKYKEGGHVAMKGDSCGHTVMKKKYGGSC